MYKRQGVVYTSKRTDITLDGTELREYFAKKSGFSYPHFNRSTRLQNVIPDEKIKVLDPVAPPNKPEGNLIMQLAPAIVMLGVTILFRVVFSSSGSSSFVWISVISMSMGIVTSVASIVSDRKKFKKENKVRI